MRSPDFSELGYGGVDEGIIAFYALFGIGAQNHLHDIKHYNDVYLDKIDFIDDKLIIGDDPGGNYFLLINGKGKSV